MRLGELLNKFSNADFLLTVDGLCDELPFWEYENEKRQPYWKKYRNRKVANMSILTTNGRPELCVRLAIDAETQKLEEMEEYEDYSQYYNKGNDCDACMNQYLTGRDGDAYGCKCRDNEEDCGFVERDETENFEAAERD